MDSMFSPTGNDDALVEEIYRQIDEAIQKHQISISALRSQRNALAPISRLPPEIFCNIFLFAKAGQGGQPLKWIKLSHVSRHWRNIAVNSPNLWVDLPVKHLRWVEEMLSRSKNASIIIEASLGTTDNVLPPGLELALKHSSRVKDLSFRLDADNLTVWDQILKHLPVSVPQLESFSIVRMDEDDEEDKEFPFRAGSLDPISIPEHVLCKTERLRHLELTNCDINWSSHSHLFQSLTHLKLHTLPKTSRPTGQQFLDALNGMPHLEFLDLQNALPIQTRKQVSWASGQIHFTSLRALNICSTDTEIEPFFSCVTFPQTAAVKVVVVSTINTQATTRKSTYSANSSSIILSLARSYSNPSSAKTFKAIVLLNPDDEFGVQLKLFAEALTTEQMALYDMFSPHLELVFLYSDLNSAKQAVANVITDIFGGAIPLLHVSQVCLHGTVPGFEAKMMAKTIGALPLVRSIMATNDASRPLLNAAQLIPAVHSRSKKASKTLYFRSLRSLCLYDPTFIDPVLNHPDAENITLGMLQDFLICRYEYGVEIRQLTLRHCHGLEREDVDLLAEIVVDVDWDEEMAPTDDEDEDEDEDRYHDSDYDSYDDYY